MVLGSLILDPHAPPRRRVGAGLVAGVAAALLLFFTGWLVWLSDHPQHPVAGTTAKNPAADPMVAELMRHNLRLARGSTPRERVEAMAGVADQLHGRSCHLARTAEGDDMAALAGLYARVESSGFYVAPAWMALARVAGARGDSNEQRRVLQHLTELDDQQATPEQRKLAQFALAELELGNSSWRASGVKSLERALEGLTDYERPKALLRAAVQRAPKDEALSALFERVARASRDPMMLLEIFERRAAASELTLFAPLFWFALRRTRPAPTMVIAWVVALWLLFSSDPQSARIQRHLEVEAESGRSTGGSFDTSNTTRVGQRVLAPSTTRPSPNRSSTAVTTAAHPSSAVFRSRRPSFASRGRSNRYRSVDSSTPSLPATSRIETSRAIISRAIITCSLRNFAMVAPAVESDRRGAGFRLLRQGSAGIWVFTSAGIWVFFYNRPRRMRAGAKA